MQLRCLKDDVLQRTDAGAQAVVAWSLSRAFPDGRLQMVAEEDSSDLRCVRSVPMRSGYGVVANDCRLAAALRLVNTASIFRHPVWSLLVARSSTLSSSELPHEQMHDGHILFHDGLGAESTGLRCAERRAAPRCEPASRSSSTPSSQTRLAQVRTHCPHGARWSGGLTLVQHLGVENRGPRRVTAGFLGRPAAGAECQNEPVQRFARHAAAQRGALRVGFARDMQTASRKYQSQSSCCSMSTAASDATGSCSATVRGITFELPYNTGC